MHWPDPARRTRIAEIRDTLLLAQVDRRKLAAEGINLGLPAIRGEGLTRSSTAVILIGTHRSADETREHVQLLVGLLGGVMGSIAGGSLTWLTTRWTLRRELEQRYDQELRAERVTAYKQLWQITSGLPRYQWPTKTTRSQLRDLIERFHTWYFEAGGLYFSQAAKDAYFAMMDALDIAAGRQASDDTAIDDGAFMELFGTAEHLRLHLAADVGTGRRPRIASVRLSPAKSPARSSD